uniref:Uncharacterized protein LOC104225279 n=1 Tax=Nicotiana sylvestris TaxID=4096 RepID=A0A1U7WM61_NICSY|nr:PREDICTED: uncharacterized protein LOC104225279 [Nicotiana sylvestris]
MSADFLQFQAAFRDYEVADDVCSPVSPLSRLLYSNDVKRNVAEFVASCPNCQQVKVEHQRPGGLAKNTDIPMWKWEIINMDFVMAPFEVLYGRICKSPIGWFEIGEAELIGPYLVHQAIDKVKIIKKQLKTDQSRQKSYSDMCSRDLELKKDDWVFLKVSSMKGIMRFGKKGKLSLRYVRPYRIIQRIG